MAVVLRRLPRKVQAEVRKTLGLPAPGKYGNEKVRMDGFKFDSLKERDRYLVLLMRQKMGEILGLEVHPKFELKVDGRRVCYYYADFRYKGRDGIEMVEDCKGVRTQAYRLKRKLMKAIYGITILET